MGVVFTCTHENFWRWSPDSEVLKLGPQKLINRVGIREVPQASFSLVFTHSFQRNQCLCLSLEQDLVRSDSWRIMVAACCLGWKRIKNACLEWGWKHNQRICYLRHKVSNACCMLHSFLVMVNSIELVLDGSFHSCWANAVYRDTVVVVVSFQLKLEKSGVPDTRKCSSSCRTAVHNHFTFFLSGLFVDVTSSKAHYRHPRGKLSSKPALSLSSVCRTSASGYFGATLNFCLSAFRNRYCTCSVQISTLEPLALELIFVLNSCNI